MPNYVKNIVQVTGSEEEIKKAKKVLKGMDFNRILPMPKTLNVNTGTKSEFALRMHLYKIIGESVEGLESFPDAERSMLSECWDEVSRYHSESYEQMMEKDKEAYAKLAPGEEPAPEVYYEEGYGNMEQDTTGYIDGLGKLLYENCKSHGCMSWYDWRLKNWGTKWRAMFQDPEERTESAGEDIRLTYDFCTAWSFPVGIFEKVKPLLLELDAEIAWAYADEDIGYNCGYFLKKKGSGNKFEYTDMDYKTTSDAISTGFANSVFNGVIKFWKKKDN